MFLHVRDQCLQACSWMLLLVRGRCFFQVTGTLLFMGVNETSIPPACARSSSLCHCSGYRNQKASSHLPSALL
uniref:Uncharacterized protein n=1 Tax=Anguilla anguilla TaxID=7936 RepID=A0A0E9XIE0_ANGAN